MPAWSLRITAFAALFFAIMPFAPAHADTNVLFIFDSSGSMWAKVDGQSKVAIARKAMSKVLNDLPVGTKLGLMSYGHRRKGDCSDIELISPIGSTSAAAIAKKINSLQPKGETPIADALKNSAGAFTGKDGARMIVLVTDGAEECKGDPCAAAKELAAQDVDLHINVVGFHLGDTQRKAVQCVADEGRGHYYDASDSKALTAALTEVKAQVVEAAAAPAPPPAPPPPPPENNLLSGANGGQVIAAPSEDWVKAISGNDKDMVGFSCAKLPTEGVFAFKDEKPATFSKFEMLIPGKGQWVKDFELLAADDSPTGTFRSLGTFTTQNLKLLKTPYQEFSFPETTAKYLKLKITSDWGGDCGELLPQVRLIGTMAASDAAPAETAKSDEVNILSPNEGGQVITAPDEKWAKVISGDEKDGASFSGCSGLPVEAVFAFKGENTATFDKFSVYVPAKGQWAKDFELLAADDSPTGTFRSLGQFTVQNLRLIKSPYQDFSFASTTAKYLKLKITSAYAGDCDDSIGQVRVMGKVGDTKADAAPVAAPDEVNLLAAKNGGQVIAGATDAWPKLISGNEQDQVAFSGCGGVPLEGVFAFKDEKPATFDKFAIYIPGAGKWVKDFEIFAANDSPTGTFRSLGQFQVRNLRVMKNQYQEFTFAPTTAKYFKFKITSGYAGDCDDRIPQLRLMGKAS